MKRRAPKSFPDGGRTGITDLVALQVKLLEGGVVPAETTEHTKRNERSRNRCATPQKVVNTAGSGATPKNTVIVGHRQTDLESGAPHCEKTKGKNDFSRTVMPHQGRWHRRHQSGCHKIHHPNSTLEAWNCACGYAQPMPSNNTKRK
jgi:hypothetical protein